MDSSERRVCIAMDGSKHSEYALQWYIKEVRKPGDHVILAHCFERQSALHTAMGTADVQAVCNIMQEEETEQKKIQEELKSKLSKSGMKGCVAGKFGKPGEVIISIARDEKANILICGTRGLGKVRRTLMGSVSDYLLHHSDIPVIVCRHKDH